MTRRADTRLAALAAAGSGVLVGAAIVATRSVVDQTGPTSLAFLRYAVGSVCLLPAVALSQRVLPRASDLIPVALLGIGQFGILIVLLNFGLQRISAAHAALIFATVPLLTLLFAVGLRYERVTRAKSLGILLSIAGVAVALGDTAFGNGQTSEAWIGDGAVFGSALCAAVCSVLYRPYLRRYPALPLSFLAMLAAVAFLAVLTARDGLQLPLAPSGWTAVGFIGAASGVGYFLWLWALGHSSATRVTVFLALSPITAAVLGVVVLGEGLSGPLIAGVACVATGVWLAHRPVAGEG